MNCTNCKYSGWNMAPNTPSAMICRRYPPKAHAIPIPTQQGVQINFVQHYPIVTDSDYCYEFSNSEPKILPS